MYLFNTLQEAVIMKLQRRLTQFLLAVIIAATGACDDFLQVNEDPTSPSQVPEDLQLSGLLGNFSYEVIGNTPARTTTQWVQQTAFNGVAPSADNYDVNSDRKS